MAKVTVNASIVAAILAGTALASPALAQQEDLLEQALDAEGQRYWQAAEAFYRQLLARDSDRADLWKRLADIIAEQGGRDEEAAEAFARAADLESGNAELQAEASAAYSTIDQPEPAYTYIKRALEIDPDNPAYWNSRSVLEGWLGDYPAAEKSLKQAFRHGLERSEPALVRLATLQQWQGKLVESSNVLEEVVERFGGGQIILLNLARLYSYRGDYATALEYIETYKETGGEEFEYAREKSLYLAWANRPDASKAVSAPALAENPEDPDLLISTAIALQRERDYDAMIETLDRLDQVTGSNQEAQLIRTILTTETRSNADLRFMASTDRDNILTYGGSGVFTYALKPGTYLRLGGEVFHLEARSGSGLDRIDNGPDILNSAVWGEIEAPLGDNVWGSLLLGESFTDFGPDAFKANAQVHFRTSDETTVSFGYDRDLFMRSPRALSLGIIRNESYIDLVWTPSIKWYIQLRGTYAWLNDTNEQGQGELTVIREVFRRNKINMDIGFSGTWFGYQQDLPNGYYDPSFVQQYFLPIYFYFKFNDNDGLSITVSPGFIKDNTMANFEFAGAISTELTFGLYRDWMMRLWTSTYIGGSGSAITPNIDDYFLISGGLRLVRRF